MMRFILLLTLLVQTSVYTLTSFSKTETLNISGSQWKIYQAENMTLQKAGKDYKFILDENIENQPDNTDLYLDFENTKSQLPNYKIISSRYEQNKYQSVNGGYSGKFYNSEHYISLLPLNTSIFSPGKITGSFTIEFWLYLYKNYDNQYIVRYIGNNLSDENDKNNYGFTIYTKNGKVIYQFNNYFWSDSGESFTYEVEEEEPFKLYQWEHHAISFNIMNGKMAVYKNGIEQTVQWITSNKKVLAPLYNPQVKDELSTPLLIGQNSIFSLDNLKISKSPVNEFYLNKYKNKECHIITDIYKISDNMISMKGLSLDFGTPDYSFVKLAYRISNAYFLPDNKTLKWVSVQNHLKEFPMEEQEGKYIQFKIVAYPQDEMEKEIVIRSLKLDYDIDKNPYVPVITRTVPYDEKLQVYWTPSPEDDIAGYEIYYGNHKGNYICQDAVEGKSPLFVPAGEVGKITQVNYTLTGLVNDKPYFISIRALDKKGHRSSFSKEIYVRPSSIYNDQKYSIEK